LYDADTNTLETAVAKTRNDSKEKEFRISKTMMERVIREKVSLLTTNTLLDDSYANAASIISQGIRSAMSVPLICKDNLLGVLHVDTTQMSTQFNPDTLELLTGIGSQSAIAIENAKLLKKIEKEVETRGHLQRYLPPELVEQIINNQIDMGVGGQLKRATIMFTDLRGFTKLTESIGAEAVVAILNDYFTRMVEIIFNTNGTLDKFIGDAIMAIWGLPVGGPEDAIHSIKAAIEMQNELFYFNLYQKKQGRSRLKMGAGINTGDVVVGNMGSPERMEYTVIGPPVNMASRVEGVTAHNQILVSENTYKEVSEKIYAVLFPPTPLKGIERVIKIYGVVALQEESGKIHFLPGLVSVAGSEKQYESLLILYKNNDFLLHIEPNEEVGKVSEINFALDIPNIAPKDVVKLKIINQKTAIHGQDEFIEMQAKVETMTSVVQNFLKPILIL
jgi:adenylate cyclase